MPTKIYVLLGISGVGKDTIASMISGQVIKFASPVKRFVEKAYGLTPGSLESREWKAALAPNGKTFLQILVDCCRVWGEVDEMFTAGMVLREIAEVKHTVILTDVRKLGEAQGVIDLNVPVVVLDIYGRGTALESDNQLSKIRQLFFNCAGPYYHVDNSADFAHLEPQIRKILHRA